MSNRCTVCRHADREEIDRALVAGAPHKSLSSEYGLAKSSIVRHAASHLPAAVVKAEEVRQSVLSLDLWAILRDERAFGQKLRDACERYLQDPLDPERFDVGPRASDVTVIYVDGKSERTGEPILRKDRLDALLARVNDGGYQVASVETRHADPRELAIKALGVQAKQSELLAKCMGQLGEGAGGAADTAQTIAAVLGALDAFPDAKAAVVGALRDLRNANARG